MCLYCNASDEHNFCISSTFCLLLFLYLGKYALIQPRIKYKRNNNIYNKGLFCGFFMLIFEDKAATIGISVASKIEKINEWVSIFSRQNIHVALNRLFLFLIN